MIAKADSRKERKEILMNRESAVRRIALDIRKLIQQNLKSCPVLTERGGSHQLEWHNKGVAGHTVWVMKNARKIYQVTGEDIFELAKLHDIGKIRGYKEKGEGEFSFKEHEGVGAKLLREEYKGEHGLSLEDILVIENHGALRKGLPSAIQELSPKSQKRFALLELADEFGKWNFEKMPPKGRIDKLTKQRNSVIRGAEKILGTSMTKKVVDALMGEFTCPIVKASVNKRKVVHELRRIAELLR